MCLSLIFMTRGWGGGFQLENCLNRSQSHFHKKCESRRSTCSHIAIPMIILYRTLTSDLGAKRSNWNIDFVMSFCKQLRGKGWKPSESSNWETPRPHGFIGGVLTWRLGGAAQSRTSQIFEMATHFYPAKHSASVPKSGGDKVQFHLHQDCVATRLVANPGFPLGQFHTVRRRVLVWLPTTSINDTATGDINWRICSLIVVLLMEDATVLPLKLWWPESDD